MRRIERDPAAEPSGVAPGLLAACARLGLPGLLLIAGGFVAAPAFGVSQTPLPAQQIAARLRFEMLGTEREGPTGRPRADTYLTLRPGEHATRYVAAGSAEDPDICHAGFVNDISSVSPIYVWQLDVRVLTVSSTAAKLQLQWQRFRPAAGREEAEAGDTRVLTLRTGDFHVFDYLAAASRASSCESLMLRVFADPLPQPDPQPLLSADLWVTQEGDAAGRWVHQRVAGRSGQPLAFGLEPLRWTSVAAIDARAEQPSVELGVKGTINATMRPDGFLDVSIRLTRTITWGRARIVGEGQQDFRCAVNEPVAIFVPVPKGHAEREGALEGRQPADGVSVRGDRTVVDFDRFFATKEISLYVLITK